MLAPWIISHFPPHRAYVEPFGGAASVLLRKPRSYAEIYNDLDNQVVGLFRVLQDPARASRLQELLRITPFARAEFELAYEVSDDPVEEARRLIIRSFMGFGSDGHNRAQRTGFRANSNRSGSTPARDWTNLPANLELIIDRIRPRDGTLGGVTLENRPAIEVMEQHDSRQTLHYVDPPYLNETRSDKTRKSGGKYHAYVHEMDDVEHERLLGFLQSLEGMVVLSGYPSDLYESALGDWHRVERDALADGARPRTEVLWINRAAHAAWVGDAGALFR